MSISLASKATPVLIVDDVEACATFWEALGFTRVAEVPHDGTLGFVILSGGDVELMYQSHASVTADDAEMGAHVRTGGASLFVETHDLDGCVKAVAGAAVVLRERTTFYGMREIGVLDPGGNVVLFAQKTEEGE
jgi:catechol 2,3-dioxygenase-like lactoylglutathione lyase family enzyme